MGSWKKSTGFATNSKYFLQNSIINHVDLKVNHFKLNQTEDNDARKRRDEGDGNSGAGARGKGEAEREGHRSGARRPALQVARQRAVGSQEAAEAAVPHEQQGRQDGQARLRGAGLRAVSAGQGGRESPQGGDGKRATAKGGDGRRGAQDRWRDDEARRGEQGVSEAEIRGHEKERRDK